ncbi:MAG: ribonuclease HII [Patescibacteria group bacterium]|nr:ribonuclease HII [Patescibacteria group bacterium]
MAVIKTFPTFILELNLQGTYRSVAGVDEAGIGPLAGPVVAAAVILRSRQMENARTKTRWWREVNDSKKLSATIRERLAGEIVRNCESFGLGSASVKEIDEMNILRARLLAMKRAVENLKTVPEMILVDGTYVIPGVALPQQAIVAADEKILSVACASILAKVTRDNLLRKLHEKFPEYRFDQHKGYPTKLHRKLLAEHGPCPEHRKTFAPIAELLRD